MTDRLILTLGILGGTGKEGQGLAYRWAKAGYHVIIGSRTPSKAEGVAAELNERLGEDQIKGTENAEAAQMCDIAVLTVPYEGQKDTLTALKDQLQGKVLVNVVVPLSPEDPTAFLVPDAGSAAQEAQEILGEQVQVVAAFQNVSQVHLLSDHPVPCDVLVCGDNQQAREQALQLVKAAGLVGWDAGLLRNAVITEGLTAVLVGINKRYGMPAAGIRITGEPSLDSV